MVIGGSQKVEAVREFPGNHYFPIRPEDIKIENGQIVCAFGKCEVEKTAAMVVSFCKRRGGWHSFTADELAEFYCEIGEDPKLMFFGLAGCWVDDGYMSSEIRQSHPCLALDINGLYAVTDYFIHRCAGHHRPA